MNVALALHGQPRFFELTYEHFFSNIIETFNADVYFHTWWHTYMIGSLYPCAPHAKASLLDEDMIVKKDTMDKLMELYNPVDYAFNGYHEFSCSNYQYYSQYAVKELLKDSETKYDLVIRSRFDLMCTQDLTFVYDDSLWVASCCPYNDGRVNDMFSISNQEVFEKISDTYLNLEEFTKEGKGEMEWALAMQIKKENIKVKKFQADYESFDVLRSDTAKQFKAS